MYVRVGVALLLCGCGGVGAGGEFTPVPTTVCSTGQQWTGREEGPSMNPGQACITCHSQGEGPRFRVAGTVFSTFSEADNCAGATDVQVVITDATGKVLTLPANSAGNFSYEGPALAMPYTAKVVSSKGERVMGGAQTTGDCNSCHTAKGAEGAPGRIVAP